MREHLDRVGEIQRLAWIASRIRRLALESITGSGTGHPGGSLSVADFLAVLYFGWAYEPQTGSWEPILRFDSADPLWANRDRVVLGKGHAAPALYAALALAGFFDEALLNIHRKIDSPLEGHPAMYRVVRDGDRVREQGTRGVDFSTGSLGHGLSAAAGLAMHSKVYGYGYQVYAVLGDGDLQEGMTWEACLTIPNKGLNNLCVFIDYNRLQVDGSTDAINSLDPLDEKLRAFNWDVLTVDGHDHFELLQTLARFKKTRGETARPFMIIGRTIKGKGAREIENQAKYHALPLTPEEFERAARECDDRMKSLERHLSACAKMGTGDDRLGRLRKSAPTEEEQDLVEIARRNPPPVYREPTPTRIGYGNALARLGEYRKIFVFNADLEGACGAAAYCARYPERSPCPADRRSLNVGVQEANMMTMAAAMASCGKISVVNSFGVFCTGRAWEMVFQDIAYPRLNVKIIGSHTGIALGEYGVSHQAISDVGAMRILPHMIIVEPSDAIQADYLFESALAHEGPVYFRVGRNPVPLIYAPGNPYGVPALPDFGIGKGYVVREGKDIALIGCGPILNEALKVAHGVRESVRVIDMPTIRPLDADLVEEAARQTGWICTLQDHFESGGLRDEVLGVISARRLQVRFDYIALAGFAKSGSPSDLYERYGLAAGRIVEKLRLRPR